MLVKATQKFIVMSPRKLRLVASLVRDMRPSDAFEKLPYVKKRAAEPLRKVIGTAIANAKQKGISVEGLSFKEIQISEGPRLKRWRAGARGRAKPYMKRMSHIRVVLETLEKASPPSSKKVDAKKEEKTVTKKAEQVKRDQKETSKKAKGGKK